MLAIQDQVVPTGYYVTHILKQNVKATKCRYCSREEESGQHLTSSCSSLAPQIYSDRHNNMGKALHQEIALHLKLKHVLHYKYQPLVIVDKRNKKCFLINFNCATSRKPI